jgi:hypothetical protein
LVDWLDWIGQFDFVGCMIDEWILQKKAMIETGKEKDWEEEGGWE